MNLFDDPLTPEAEKLIYENVALVNQNIARWISQEKLIKGGITRQVLDMITEAKKRHGMQAKTLEETDARKRKVEKLVRMGHGVPQFKGVFDFKVRTWKGTDFEAHLTPETLLQADKFTKYLEAAREEVRTIIGDKKPGAEKKTAYDDLMNE